MLLIIGVIGGLIIGIITFLAGIESMKGYNDKTVGFFLIIISVICLVICVYCLSNMYTESIETVTIANKFIDLNHNPSNGFMDTNDIEYHYYPDSNTLNINSTYKMKIQHNQDTGFNQVLYIYT
jgi:hypothetical protein